MLGLSNIAQRFFGSSNDRKVRPMMARTAEINALEPHYVKKTDEQLKDMTAQFKARLAKGETLEDLLPESLRGRPRGGVKRTLGQRHFDVQLGRAGHGAPRRQHRRDEDRRGQDPRRHPRRLSQRPRRQGRPHRDRQRLPRPPRLRMDGPSLSLPRPHRRLHRARPFRRPAPRELCLRRDLRHEQRVRLRLSARQHEVLAGDDGPAQAFLRDRRRGGLHPGRRGAHAADHPPARPRTAPSSTAP